jgi:hypothetical protein
MPPPKMPIPVLGFGPHKMPEKDEVFKRLHEADTRRFGSQLMKRIEEHNATIEGQRESAREDLATLHAEIAEYLLDGEGRHPFPRVYVPRSV